jgi:hypothetical protein
MFTELLPGNALIKCLTIFNPDHVARHVSAVLVLSTVIYIKFLAAVFEYRWLKKAKIIIKTDLNALYYTLQCHLSKISL